MYLTGVFLVRARDRVTDEHRGLEDGASVGFRTQHLGSCEAGWLATDQGNDNDNDKHAMVIRG